MRLGFVFYGLSSASQSISLPSVFSSSWYCVQSSVETVLVSYSPEVLLFSHLFPIESARLCLLTELYWCSFWILSLVLGGGNGWSRGSSQLEFEFDLLFSSSRWRTNNPSTIPNSCLVMVCWFPNLLCKSVGSLVIGAAPFSNPSFCNKDRLLLLIKSQFIPFLFHRLMYVHGLVTYFY